VLAGALSASCGYRVRGAFLPTGVLERKDFLRSSGEVVRWHAVLIQAKRIGSDVN
jgi:hypothetical protein